jgi:hypothetical protein
MKQSDAERQLAYGLAYGTGVTNMKKLLQENMADTNTSESPTLLSDSKDKSIIPPFKGFCSKAQKNHSNAYIKRYLTGLMADSVFPTPVNEATYISKLPDA